MIAYDEFVGSVSGAGVRNPPGKISLSVPAEFRRKLLYLYIVMKVTAGSSFLEGKIDLKKRQRVLETLPVGVYDGGAGLLINSRTKVLLFNAGGVPIKDSVTLILDDSWPGSTAGNAVLVQPFEVSSDCDEISMQLDSITQSNAGATSNYKAWLGCISRGD